MGLLPYQEAPCAHLTEILRTHGAALDASDTGCLAKDTQVLLFDGTSIAVQDVVEGMDLLGPDALPRKVLSLKRGREEMCKITLINGETFICNQSHILTLVRFPIDKNGVRGGTIKDISVRDFKKLNPTEQGRWKSFTRGPVNHWTSEITVDPYLLGALLGDGGVTTNTISFTSGDIELLEFCKGVAETYGGRLYICKNYTGSDCTSINFRAVPELYSQMYSLGLMLKRCEHKFIPSQYKKGTAEVRRKVLAGLLDTDGSASNNCYDFISKSKQLSEDVVFIARSLGMRAVMRPSEKFCQTGGGGTYWRVCISGEGLDKLPMLLSRKKSRPRKQIKDARRFGFTITDLPEDDFYGFTLDGDGRFTLSNFIITHNTGKTYVGINAAKRLDLPVGIVCPKSVIPSWERVCASEGVEPAFIANYEKLVHGNTDIVSRKRRAFTWNFGGIVLFDEVDRCKSHTSLAGRLLTSAWESRLIRCHCMSATAAQNPMEMRALGFVLGLHNDYDFFKWVQEKGAKKNRWDQYVCAPTPEVMEQIHHAIFPARGVRVRISDLGNAFPENQVLVENLAIADIAEVNAAYAEAQELLMALNAKAEHDTTNAFTIILRARQRAELAKIPVLVEQAENLLREGASVAIFVNFNDTLEAVAKHLNTDCVVRAQKAEDRKKNLDAFQSNESRVIVLNTQAGGVGVNLHDVHGGHRRVSLLCPSYNARNLKQALGRIHRSGAKSPCVQKLIFAAGTVEDRVAASIRSKLQAMDKLNDNDLDDGLSWYLQQL